MSLFDEMMDDTSVVDCMIEIHELKLKANTISDERLIKFIMDWDSAADITDATQLAIDSYFNTGKLDKKNRYIVEYCYVLMRNNLCWGEAEDESGVFHTTILSK
jgi:hypothetical protein